MKINKVQHGLGMANLVKFGLAGVMAMALTVTTARGGGNQGNPGVMPPQAHAFGQTYGELAAAWWQWVLGMPMAGNPQFDETGEAAAAGQEGKVWFLAGCFGGTYERTCQVPAGKALFFPVVNNIWIGYPGDDPTPIEDLRAKIAGFIDQVQDTVTCEIDGKPVKNLSAYRCESPVFNVNVPVDPEGWQAWTIPAGVDGPCVDDGLYLLLAPLAVGQHTIHFTVPGFVDITYNLTVTPAK